MFNCCISNPRQRCSSCGILICNNCRSGNSATSRFCNGTHYHVWVNVERPRPTRITVNSWEPRRVHYANVYSSNWTTNYYSDILRYALQYGENTTNGS